MDKGADVAALGYMGWTALHYAARGGHPETCRILLKRGADREAVCKLKRTALQGADSPETRHVLLSFKVLIPGIKDFIFAASTGDLKKAQELLEKTPGLLNATGPAGRTAAMEAAAHNRVEVLQWLIESDADINLLTKDREESALYLATLDGHVEAVRLLLKHKAEVNPPPTDKSDLTATPSPLSEATNVFRYSERGARMAAAMSKGGSEGELKKHLLAEANEGELFGELLKGMFQQIDEPLYSRKLEIAKLLIAAGAKPDIKGRGTPLGGAVIAQHEEISRLLLNAGANPNRGTMGASPFVFSIALQAPGDIITLLLEKGADPLLKGKDSPLLSKEIASLPLSQKSAMSLAAEMENVERFEILFESLDLKKLTNKQKGRALTDAARHPDCLKIVLSAGFDVNLANDMKQTALHIAANRDKPEAVRLLLEKGADVRVRDFAGFTPLHNAAEHGETENVKLLLEKDASLIEARTNNDATPLMCSGNSDNMVKTATLLIKKGAKVDAKMDGACSTALMFAASWGHAELVELLINAGAKVNATSEYWSVLGAAATCGAHYEDLKVSEGYIATKIGLEDDYLRIAGLLIKHQADVNLAGTKKGEGVTPIESALHAGSEAMLKLLLSHHADPDKANKSMFGRTSIWKAIFTGNQKMFDLIMAQDVNLQARDAEKLTPLHFAAGMDQPEMVKMLIKKGALIDVQEKNGATPLIIAIFKNAPKSARILLEAGADRTIPDYGGNTPMQVAKIGEKLQMIELLKTIRKK